MALCRKTKSVSLGCSGYAENAGAFFGWGRISKPDLPIDLALSVGPQGRSRRVPPSSSSCELRSTRMLSALFRLRASALPPDTSKSQIDLQRLQVMQGASSKMAKSTVSARISPVAGMDVLSRDEVSRLRDASLGGLHALLRRCALAVLTSGSMSDDPRSMVEIGRASCRERV